MLLTIIILSIVCTLLSFYLKYKLNVFNCRGVKCMSPKQQLLCELMTMFGIQSMSDHFSRVIEYFPGERYIGIFNGLTPIILARSPDAIKKICVEKFDCFEDHSMRVELEDDSFFGRQIFFMKGQKWRDMRADLSPAYGSLKAKTFFDYLNNYIMETIQHYPKMWNQDVCASDDGKFYEVNAREIIAQHAYGYYAKTLFNDDSQNIVTEMKEICNSCGVLTYTSLLKIMILRKLPKFLKTRMRLFAPNFWRYFENALITCFKWRKDQNISIPDLVQMLMESKKDWTIEEITAQTFQLTNTYANSLVEQITNTLHELVCNPEILKRLKDEVDSVNRKTGGQLELNDLNNMEYLEMVISESFRKWPSASITDRICTKDCDLGLINDDSDRTLKIKKGDEVLIHIYSIHNDPQYWNEPEKFDPERFSKENKSKIKPYSFIPFGAGPRYCLAMRHGYIHIKLMIYNFILNFEIKRGDKMKDERKLAPHTLVVKIDGGTWLKIRPR